VRRRKGIAPLLAAAILGGATILAAGCGASKPPPADRAAARAILQVALEAWKKGELPSALQDRDPPIVVADHEWTAGKKLLDFKVDDKDQLFGADLRCTVHLTSEAGAAGKTRNKKATYSVGTHRTFTVVREDDD
jgi:hypothetical protein